MGLGQFGLGCQCCGPANDCPNDSSFEDFPFTAPPPPAEFFYRGYPSSATDWLGSHWGYNYFQGGRVRMRVPYSTREVPGQFPPVTVSVNENSFMWKRDLVALNDPNPTLPHYKQKRQSFSVSSRFYPIQNYLPAISSSLYSGAWHGLFLTLLINKNSGPTISLSRPASIDTGQGSGYFLFFGVQNIGGPWTPNPVWRLRYGSNIIPTDNQPKDVEIQAVAESDQYRIRYLVNGVEIASETDSSLFWDRCNFSAGVELITIGVNPANAQPWNQIAYAEFERFNYAAI